MKVRQLISILKRMPQNEEIGVANHDYDEGDSDSISTVSEVYESDNDSGKICHRVVIRT